MKKNKDKNLKLKILGRTSIITVSIIILLYFGLFAYSIFKIREPINNIDQSSVEDAANSIISSVESAYVNAFNISMTLNDIKKEYNNPGSVWNDDNTITHTNYDFVCNATVNSKNEMKVSCDVDGKKIESDLLSLGTRDDSTEEDNNNDDNNNSPDIVKPEESKPQTGSLSSLVATSAEVPSKPACLIDGTVCAPGTPVAIKVNSTDIYNFYVMSESGNKVTLIMDRNLGDKVAWVTENDYLDAGGSKTDFYTGEYGGPGNTNLGPITALNYLNIQTETWTNIVQIKDYQYVNNENGTKYRTGYQKLTIIDGNAKLISQDAKISTSITGISRARLLTLEEAVKLTKSNSDVTPMWLHPNLYVSPDLSLREGYWLLSGSSGVSSNNAAYMSHDGCITCFGSVRYAYHYGIRPVITLTK